MKRIAYKQLLKWKTYSKRKPLIIKGARQVGKTYLVNEFGKNEYSNYFYFNFEKEPDLASLFQRNLDPLKIIENLGLYIGKKIPKNNCLIFFDEVQASPIVLTSLKYFQEQAPDYHIISAGSLLGVGIKGESAFPVGKVSFLEMFPMSFQEFLWASDNQLLEEKILNNHNLSPIPDAIHNKIIDLLKIYLFIGGMPEVVRNYFEEKDISRARQIQEEILISYRNDFSKYADSSQTIRISDFWNSIPNQLAKENKKFKYSDVKKNSRASYFESTIEWLAKAGLINIIYSVETSKLPLSSFADYSKFKIYFHDVGLLSCELKIPSGNILSEDALFTDFKGAFIENFIAQELKTFGLSPLFYWTSNKAKVDFLISNGYKIFPLEVKSGLSKNTKSLRSYEEKFSPDKIFRLSPRNYHVAGSFNNLPLYAAMSLVKLLNINYFEPL